MTQQWLTVTRRARVGSWWGRWRPSYVCTKGWGWQTQPRLVRAQNSGKCWCGSEIYLTILHFTFPMKVWTAQHQHWRTIVRWRISLSTAKSVMFQSSSSSKPGNPARRVSPSISSFVLAVLQRPSISIFSLQPNLLLDLAAILPVNA